MPVFKTIPLGYTYLNAKKPSATAQNLRKKRAQEHPSGKQTPNADTSNYTKDKFCIIEGKQKRPE